MWGVAGKELSSKLTPAIEAVDVDRLRRVDRKIHDQLVLLRVQAAPAKAKTQVWGQGGSGRQRTTLNLRIRSPMLTRFRDRHCSSKTPVDLGFSLLDPTCCSWLFMGISGRECGLNAARFLAPGPEETVALWL
jgi:hypothetical protein